MADTVKNILIKAGFNNVDDETFEFGSETIHYWEGTSWYHKNNTNNTNNNTNSNNGRYIIGNNGNHLNEINKFIDYINAKKDAKCFIFYQINTCSDYLFSFEIKNYKKNEQCDILTDSDINTYISNSTETIIRIPRSDKAYMVAIKIKDSSGKNDDFSSLKHYIISSDNRTYNHVIRNGIEYVFTNNKIEIPENKSVLPHNLLVSGAPGTGKSNFLKESVIESGNSIIDEIANKISKEPSVSPDVDKEASAKKIYMDNYVTRVTFYEDYSYENFIGCYKPLPSSSESNIEYDGKKGKISEEKITYEYVSGPFIDTYIKAKNDPEHSYFLIIEEINRAKAASVFGDMFQLLDRKKGVSEYDIVPDASLNEYLKNELKEEYTGTMKLPSNMYLWATMNSADQGVMPLDSAFKRRWSQKYMDINPVDKKIRICNPEITIPDQPSKNEEGKRTHKTKKVDWNKLRTAINDVILNNGFDEDRCIGSWYFSEEEFSYINEYFEDKNNEGEQRSMPNPIIDKLLYYLRQDVFRRIPTNMFRPETDEKPGLSMSDIRRRVRQGNTLESILNIDEIPAKTNNS